MGSEYISNIENKYKMMLSICVMKLFSWRAKNQLQPVVLFP